MCERNLTDLDPVSRGRVDNWYHIVLDQKLHYGEGVPMMQEPVASALFVQILYFFRNLQV